MDGLSNMPCSQLHMVFHPGLLPWSSCPFDSKLSTDDHSIDITWV
ncbi:unnamed protein product [Penicillium roqueforti FM164]|uniref:Genomic scaffold, ProqFM164S04 n=1 Tax=Penicillium roqueforti (strain FM164) TaxID=1365484 RepID=W6QFT4_PENRF|nr:unnamed protein product [Penicillium roqueforti FM164]